MTATRGYNTAVSLMMKFTYDDVCDFLRVERKSGENTANLVSNC